MSRKFVTPLRLEPRASRQLGRFLAVVHVMALGILPFTQLPPLVIAAIAPLVVFSYLHSHRLHVSHRAPQAIAALHWDSGNHWQLTLGSGTTVSAALVPRVFIQPWLVILHFKPEHARTACLVLLSDMLAPDDFRKLRVRLLIDMQRLATPGSR